MNINEIKKEKDKCYIVNAYFFNVIYSKYLSMNYNDDRINNIFKKYIFNQNMRQYIINSYLDNYIVIGYDLVDLITFTNLCNYIGNNISLSKTTIKELLDSFEIIRRRYVAKIYKDSGKILRLTNN